MQQLWLLHDAQGSELQPATSTYLAWGERWPLGSGNIT